MKHKSSVLTSTMWFSQAVLLCYVKSISYERFGIDSMHVSHVDSNDLNTDMCKFESSQKDESRSHSADFSKAYRKPTGLNCSSTVFGETLLP